MGKVCFKMTEPGVRCRGYQFKVDEVNLCEAATCQDTGFHAAENPLDCFSYYPSFKSNEFYLCLADGEVHENMTDSKLSCTELIFVKRLELWEVVTFACHYIVEHPKRRLSDRVCKDHGMTNDQGYAVVVGRDPTATCRNYGDVLGLVRTDENGLPVEFAVITGETTKKGKTYDIQGQEVTAS